MKPNLPITIQQMNRGEVDLAIDWAQKEGWNPGVHDAECFYQTDPDGFYAVKLDGEIVGSVSIVKYSKEFCFGGLYIVKPEFRDKGIGLYIMQFVLDLTKDTVLGVDGVLSMHQKYQSDGLYFAHNNTRYKGIASGTRSEKCVPIAKQDFKEVNAYDRVCFGVERPTFLRCWLYQPDAASLLVHNIKGSVAGYGVIRKCGVGHKIGPLFADDASTAEILFEGLTSTVRGDPVFLDVPQPNVAATRLTQKCGMQAVFSTVRMYTKVVPKLPLEKIFGITTFELG